MRTACSTVPMLGWGGGGTGRGWGLKEGGDWESVWNTLEFLGDVEIAGPPPLEKGYIPVLEKDILCGVRGEAESEKHQVLAQR